MVTSHNVQPDATGRPLSPSVPFAPAADITRLAQGWMIRQRAEKIEDDHFRVQVQGKDVSVQDVIECGSCGHGIFILSPDLGRPGYLVNVAQLQAAVVSHIHTHHPEAL